MNENLICSSNFEKLFFSFRPRLDCDRIYIKRLDGNFYYYVVLGTQWRSGSTTEETCNSMNYSNFYNFLKKAAVYLYIFLWKINNQVTTTQLVDRTLTSLKTVIRYINNGANCEPQILIGRDDETDNLILNARRNPDDLEDSNPGDDQLRQIGLLINPSDVKRFAIIKVIE